VHDLVKSATEKLDQIQSNIDSNGHSDHLMQQEQIAQASLEHALNVEELFWQQKSKAKWHSDGDRNTTYFHRLAKIRNASSLITSIKTMIQ
jgi:N-acetyl-beta-hexosaminidase